VATKVELKAAAQELCFRACTDCESADECDPDEAWIEEARVTLAANEIKNTSKKKTRQPH
jgi:hypothetical protein